MIRKYFLDGIGLSSLMLVLLFCIAGVALTYVIDFIIKRMKKNSKS